MRKFPVVRFFTDDDGDLVENDAWHWVDAANFQGNTKFCTQELFGCGESPLEYESTFGEVTCSQCVAKLRLYRAVATQMRITVK